MSPRTQKACSGGCGYLGGCVGVRAICGSGQVHWRDLQPSLNSFGRDAAMMLLLMNAGPSRALKCLCLTHSPLITLHHTPTGLPALV